MKAIKDKLKAIYFGDPLGDVDEEADEIKKSLESHGIAIEIKATDRPPFYEAFDILFFDWGGASIGNSMLGHFCRWIVDHAENHPGNLYIMTSVFTEEAMKDALETLPDVPNNIYLGLSARETIKALKMIVASFERGCPYEINRHG